MAGVHNARPWTGKDDTQLRRLHKQGLSLRRIAETMHRNRSTISRHSKQLGLKYNREATRKMTEAHQADAAELRTRLSLRLLEQANRLVDTIDSPQTMVALSQKGVWVEHVVEKPPPADVRNIMTSIGIASQRSIELTKLDQQSEASTTVIDDYLKTLGIS